MITIVIAEDHQALIDGIKLSLDYEDDISVVGEANDGELLIDIVRKKQPQVVITDIRMPNATVFRLLKPSKRISSHQSDCL